MEIIINFEVIHKLNHLSHGIQVEFLKNIMDMSLQVVISTQRMEQISERS